MLYRAGIPLLLALFASPAVAQTPPTTPVTAPSDSCATGRISYVYIDNASIFDTNDPDTDKRFLKAYRLANALHIRTKDWVIRRELLFGPGTCFDRFLLDETERVLRANNFLSEVDIFEVPQPDSTYHVVVDTRDEWSTRVDVRISTSSGLSVDGVRISEDNLLGTGQSLGFFYVSRDVTRDYGVSYFAPQLLGTRWDLTSAVGKTRAGTLVHQEVAYPFVGEVSKWAGRQSFRRDEQFFDYIATDDPTLRGAHVLMPMREEAFDLAVLRRIGQRGNMALVGAALSYQQLSYPGRIEVAPTGNFNEREDAPDSLAAPILAQRQQLDNIRAFALVGHRNVWWVRRRGLDSMRGQEDVKLGAEAVLALGRALPSIETDDDLYSMLGMYTGFEVGRMLVIGRARADARRDLTANANQTEWEDVYLESDVLAYLQAQELPRQTLFFRMGVSGGWHTRTPFQLSLGGGYGLRGYDQERLPAGRRFVATIEDRFFIGWPLPGVLDLGGTVFADIGRAWKGDAPFGVDSGWRGSAGFGLRGSFPAGSRSTYRVDIAWPVHGTASFKDYRLSLTIGELRGLNPRESDHQIVRSRTQNIGGPIFSFRN